MVSAPETVLFIRQAGGKGNAVVWGQTHIMNRAHIRVNNYHFRSCFCAGISRASSRAGERVAALHPNLLRPEAGNDPPMSTTLTFTAERQRFDEYFTPSAQTRLTTNFANLARGAARAANLHRVLRMMDHRFNALAGWDNPRGDRYSLRLEIVTVALTLDGTRIDVPAIEMLHTQVTDHQTGAEHPGITGNSFSSYLRDYDFSLVLPRLSQEHSPPRLPDDFGVLHAGIYKSFVRSEAYKALSAKQPVICLSVSTKCRYQRLANVHPVLGVEYQPGAVSLTDAYFAKMGLQMRCFMPRGSQAPLAFYFSGDLLNDYTNLELISTIATMETFQRVYRPEIYNANASAGPVFQPSLSHGDYSLTRIGYDRDERNRLALEQAKRAEEVLILPYGARLKALQCSQAA